MNSLKKCPFCGGEAKLYEQEFSGKTMYEVACKNSSCTYLITQKTSPEYAVTAWNTRYDDLESRTCKNCKHGGNCSIQYSATIDFAKEPNNFSCEAWEQKQ